MLQDEADKMALMRHPNLCSFMGVCLRPPCLLTGEEVQSVYSPARPGPILLLLLLPPVLLLLPPLLLQPCCSASAASALQ